VRLKWQIELELERPAVEGDQLVAPGGFSALWAHHAFRESCLLALIKAPNDPKWFEEVHTLLHGIRGPLNLVGSNLLHRKVIRVVERVLLFGQPVRPRA